MFKRTHPSLPTVAMVAFGLAISLSNSDCGAQAPSASPNLAQHFPPSTAIFLQVDQPADLISKIERHPVVDRVTRSKQMQTLMASPEFAMAMMGKIWIESQLGQSLLNASKINLAEGLAIGVDAQTEGLAIVFKTKDEAKLKRLVGSALNLIASGAKNDGKPVPFKKDKYRDAVVAKFDDFLIGRYESWFIISDKPALAKQIADNLIDGCPNSLADQAWFKAAQASHAGQKKSDAWFAVDLETLRNRQIAPKLFQGTLDNPGAELVMGGVFDVLKNAPTAMGQLTVDDAIELSLASPFDAQWASEARRFFYGEKLSGIAPTPLLPKNWVASLTSYRDIADWWLSKEDLYSESVIARLAQADSQLSTIFSGMDFGEDVLGSLQPGVQIVFAEKEFGKKYVPDIRLPSFALIGKLKDPETIRRKLKIAYQSVIGFANIGLGAEGQPQLDLETETIDGAKVSAAQYFVDEDSQDGLLLYNFSPTIAFQGPYFIVSSDRDLAIELAKLANVKSKESNSTKTNSKELSDVQPNTRLRLDGVAISRLLKVNQEALIAQNMLEKGFSRKKSVEEIEILVFFIDLIRDVQIDFHVQPDEMRLESKLRFVR